MAELPTGTVTFLFTDLESSTRLWEEQPEAMRLALARHDDLLTAAIEAHVGHVIKGTGDGVHAVFATADAAVTAALDAQGGLAAERWGETEMLRVRMGLHTGTAELRGGDYYGSTPNRAARLMAVAHGGQVVCSHATADLARDVLGEVQFLDLGEHRLRDLSRAERVFQVCGAGLRQEFPALASLDAFPGNLPSQLSSFVGRSRELAAIPEALHEARLVTLIGVGGVGKTRLAAQVAGEVLPRFPDGAWFCELAAARDPVALVESVAATVGARPRTGVSIAESLVEYLRTKTMLLVLDNCEHLLNEAAELAEAILRGAVAVRVLATSREALAVDGERLVPVRSLGLPPARDLAAAEASDALRLFEARGGAARPGFRLDDSNLAASVEICQRLDGIPLAIELAAARLAAMSPAEISGHLDERFRLLTGGRRLGVERHQTLRAAVDWSYALLGDAERALFDRLGVFAGSFDAQGATAIAAGTGVESWDVLDALSGLVAKTMLGAEETADGTMRYQLLQTLNQYALERLDETGNLDECRRVHAAHYATFAEEIAPKLLGPDELRSRRLLRSELDNLRAAVNWALDSKHDDDVEFAARIVAALAAQASAYRVAGIVAWAQRVLARADTIRPDLRVGVLAAASWDATIHIDYPRAFELGYAALDAAENQRDAITKLALGPVCVALLYSGRPDEAASVAKRALSLLDDSPGTGFARASMQVVPSMAEIMRGDIAKARHEAQATLTVARNSGNPSAIALATFELGWALMYRDPDEALRVFDESIQLVRQGATDMIFPHVLARAAVLRAARGDRTALNDLRDAIAFSHDFGGQTTMVSVLDYSIRVLASLGYHQTGAVVAGFLDTGRPLSLFPVDGPERAGREQARENMLNKLGSTTYHEAQSRGAQLTYDALIDYLLRNLDANKPQPG